MAVGATYTARRSGLVTVPLAAAAGDLRHLLGRARLRKGKHVGAGVRLAHGAAEFLGMTIKDIDFTCSGSCDYLGGAAFGYPVTPRVFLGSGIKYFNFKDDAMPSSS